MDLFRGSQSARDRRGPGIRAFVVHAMIRFLPLIGGSFQTPETETGKSWLLQLGGIRCSRNPEGNPGAGGLARPL